MSDSEVLIRCDNVGKRFCRDLKKSLWYGLKDSAADLLGRGSFSLAPHSSPLATPDLRPGEFWANQNIDFEVRRGQCLALIGRNGAGKTTLLKMINGLIKPDCGSITIRGTVSGLIALGAGFDPVLTGRENILVNGSILGLSRRQINDRIEKIVDFAELSDAIDSPVRNYSSGMQVRLGFSAAVNLIQPDVLLLDEVLAVGDIGFTIKCLNAMRELTARCAVIFVTHSMQFVSSFCTHAMLMEKGTSSCYSDDIGIIIDQYHRRFSPEESKSGNGGAEISRITLSSPGTDISPSANIGIPHGSRVTVEMDIENSKAAFIQVYIHSQNLVPLVASEILNKQGSALRLPPGRHTLTVDLGQIEFNAGLYPLVIGVQDEETKQAMVRLESAATIRVHRDRVDWGFVSRSFTGHLETHHECISIHS